MMSRDRVKFSINRSQLTTDLRNILCDCFTILNKDIPRKMSSYETKKVFTIICRPSQFARFIIVRNAAGLRNGIKELDAHLFTPEASAVLDVSKNSNMLSTGDLK